MVRIGVIGIVVENRGAVLEVQNLLSSFGEIIIGRMGVPDKDSGVSAISVIVKGTTEQISSLCGKLGKVDGIYVKSALSSYDIK